MVCWGEHGLTLVRPQIPAGTALERLCGLQKLPNHRGQEAVLPLLAEHHAAVCQELVCPRFTSQQGVEFFPDLWRPHIDFASLGVTGRINKGAPPDLVQSSPMAARSRILFMEADEPPVPLPCQSMGLPLAEILAPGPSLPQSGDAALNERLPLGVCCLCLLWRSSCRCPKYSFAPRPV